MSSIHYNLLSASLDNGPPFLMSCGLIIYQDLWAWATLANRKETFMLIHSRWKILHFERSTNTSVCLRAAWNFKTKTSPSSGLERRPLSSRMIRFSLQKCLMSIISTLNSFLQNTSMHGVKNCRSFASLASFIWFLLVCISFFGVTIHISKLLEHFFLFPVTSRTSMAFQHEDLETFALPDVTFCFSNQFKFQNDTGQFSLINNASFTSKIFFRICMESFEGSNETLWNECRRIAKRLGTQSLRSTFFDASSTFYLQPRDAVVSCQLARTSCSALNFSVVSVLRDKQCMTFSSPDMELTTAGPTGGWENMSSCRRFHVTGCG